MATGGVEGNYTNKFLKDGVHHLQNGSGARPNRPNNALMATGANTFGGAVNDILDVVVDPTTPTMPLPPAGMMGCSSSVTVMLVAICPDNSTLQMNGLGAENKVGTGHSPSMQRATCG